MAKGLLFRLENITKSPYRKKKKQKNVKTDSLDINDVIMSKS